MTRINLIDPMELSRQHLVAEYRELPRIFALARKARERGETPADRRNPTQYVLGTGHCRFFYPRLGWLRDRFSQLVTEMQRRGYKTSFEEWRGSYVPTSEAIDLNRQRISERMQYDAEEKLREIREILADPIIERECGSADNFLRNVERWAKRLIAAANESRVHPRTSDHTPERLRNLSVIAESLSHDVGGHFDDLQDICNILQDVADEREGVIFEPELATAAPQDSIVTVRLNANEWEAFQKALAEPPKPNERLQRLMTEPSVFDETFASDDWRATMTINVARNEG